MQNIEQSKIELNVHTYICIFALYWSHAFFFFFFFLNLWKLAPSMSLRRLNVEESDFLNSRRQFPTLKQFLKKTQLHIMVPTCPHVFPVFCSKCKGSARNCWLFGWERSLPVGWLPVGCPDWFASTWTRRDWILTVYRGTSCWLDGRYPWLLV